MSIDAVERPKARPSGAPFRLSGRASLIVMALLGIVAVYATDQIVPASSAREAQLRLWLANRAAGNVALVLLTVQLSLGLILSHPTNKSTWKLSKRIFPWHEHLWVFVMAFLLVHIVATVLDPYAKVSVLGALVPGMSTYRSPAVALGTMALYALLITAISARWTKLLPPGVWLTIHRVSLVVFVLAWLHAELAGSDSASLGWLYAATGIAVLLSGSYRYWASRQRRPTFDTSRTEVTRS
jgi:predicted ferric reductase